MDPSIKEMQYHDIITGTEQEGTMNTGGLYKRHMNEPILTFVLVDDIDKVLAKVEDLGGRITLPKAACQRGRGNSDDPGLRRKCDRPLEAGEEVVQYER